MSDGMLFVGDFHAEKDQATNKVTMIHSHITHRALRLNYGYGVQFLKDKKLLNTETVVLRTGYHVDPDTVLNDSGHR
jgi:hypothetical protein